MDFFSIDPFAPATNEILERNLEALARTSPKAANLIRAATPRPDVDLSEAEDGRVTGVFADGRRLASARSPMVEATRLADTVDVAEAAGVCVVGFGLGHHLRMLGERMSKTGILLCFEPDIALLRAVFEKVDHSHWMLGTNFVLLTDADDGAAITRSFSGMEAVIALGVRVLEHPASRARLGLAATTFSQRFTDVLKAIRTTLVTTLVQSETTLTNLLMNLDHYASSPGINDLRSCGFGVPAVVVAAGPSLAKNIEVLSRPGVRDRVIIIAVQTVLRTLLDRGIRPHFVCALDHHEISRRFYEGLSAEDVEGVTLVVEPKANPAILDVFPGVIRSLGDDLLDSIVRDSGVAHSPHDRLKPGATVAHLCHYLARYMGCDPVILVGQDLGFTDGQYYAAGAAIHDVWACELNPFTTLEMREWERIAREKSLLRVRADVFGRRMYTDEQMSTYLAQFESDFAADVEAGLQIIDATEGGIAKQYTTPMSLADAISRFASIQVPTIPETPRAKRRPEALSALKSRVTSIRADARRVNLLSRDTARLLKKIRRADGDTRRINEVVKRVHKIRDEVMQLQPAFALTQFMNQTGALNRARADRAIDLDADANLMAKQLLRTERDIRNVESIAEAAQRLCSLLEETAGALSGGAKRTRDVVGETTASGVRLHRRRVAAVLHVDFEQGGLGTTRSVEEPIVGELNPLRLTIARLLAARRLGEVVCLTDDEPRLRRAVGDLGDRVRFAPLDVARFRARLDVIGPARRFAPASWRGGIAQLSCFDELFEPRSLLEAVDQFSLDACVLVGADWCLVDPSMIDAIVERYLEHPEAMRLTFTQASPGLCGCLIDRAACTTLGQNTGKAGVFATIGALMSYVPFAPQADPIAKPMCVHVPPAVRDLGVRCIPDSALARGPIERVLRGVDPVHSDANVVVTAMSRGVENETAPQHIEIELSAHSRGTGHWCAWVEQAYPDGGQCLAPTEQVCALISALPAGSAVTLHGRGDPLDHPELGRIVSHARTCGVSTHLRTMLRSDRWRDVLNIGVDVVSVDVLAAGGSLYEQLVGVDEYDVVRGRVETLLADRAERVGDVGIAIPWIVPRITRCDEVYEHIEAFYDGWLMACGCAVIDPLPVKLPTARIQALPKPRTARLGDLNSMLRLRADGSVADHGNINAFDVGLADAWSLVRRARGLGRKHGLALAA